MRIGLVLSSHPLSSNMFPLITHCCGLPGTNGRLPAGQIPRHSLVQFSHRAQHEDVSTDYILLHRRHITRSRRQIPSLFASASFPVALAMPSNRNMRSREISWMAEIWLDQAIKQALALKSAFSVKNIDCSDDVSTDYEAMENQRFLLRTDPCNQGLVAQGR